MNRDDFKLSESESGRWLVTYQPTCVSSTDDLGRGAAMQMTSVHCREAGEYFIRMEMARELAVQIIKERDWLVRDVAAACYRRNVRKRLREIIERYAQKEK